MVLRSSAPLGFAAASVVACFVAVLQPACGFDAAGSAAPAAQDSAAAGPLDGGGRADGSSAGLDMPAVCPADHAMCGADCVDLTSDPSNCSQCGKGCAFNEGCKGGACFLLCAQGTTACGGKCVDLTSDLANCGKCDAPCATLLVCSAGACASTCATNLARCPTATAAVCADLATDPTNCGACGTVCGATERCTAGKCTTYCASGVVVGDVFAPKMVGCVGAVSFASRATLCAPGVAPCGVATYRALRGPNAPHYNYWTNDVLYGAGDLSACAVSLTPGGSYTTCSSTSPMRVCGAHTDAVGNQCNTIGCGYQAYSPNEYYGGCTGNLTAGTLCCPP